MSTTIPNIPAHSQPVTVFPQEIEVTITFKLSVNNQEERNYYLNPETSQPTAGFLSDMAENIEILVVTETLLTINNLTPDQLLTVLQAQQPQQ